MDKRKKQNTRRSAPLPPTASRCAPPKPQLFDQMAPPQPRSAPPKQSVSEIMLPVAVQEAPPKRKASANKKQPKRAQPADTAARRVTRSEARRRRNRRRIMALLLLLAVIITGFVLSVTVLFKIETFVLEGESPYPIEELQLAFGHGVGDNIFSFSIKTAEKGISETLPYIESVAVRRRLPGTVVFKVTPAAETFYTASGTGYAVLSASLKVLRLSQDLPTGLVEIVDAAPVLPQAGKPLELETPERIQALSMVLDALNEAQLAPVTQLDITSELEISFLYEGRARVILGTKNDLPDKLAIAKTVLTQNISPTERGTLDVSHQSENQPRQGVWRAGKIT